MRKSHICLALIFALSIAAFAVHLFPSSPLNALMNWSLFAGVLVALIIAAFYFEFEAVALSSKEIALVSMLGTLSAVLRIPFAAIPGVQPSSFLIICSGYVFGPVAGFMVGAMTALVSNFFLGQGPWTPFQMFAWGLAGASASYLRRFSRGRIWLAVFGIFWGFLYGLIMNTWFWSSFVYPLTLRTFVVVEMNSLWFDTFHAIGNAVFLGLFGMKTIAILERFKKRFNWRLSRGPDAIQ